MDTPDFKEHFSSLLTESEEHLSTLDQFLVERLEQAEINDPQTVIAGIDAVLDSIDRNHENLTASKQTGTSRTAWLQQSLAEQKQKPLSIDDVTAMIAGQIGQLAPMDKETVEMFQQFAKKMIEQAGTK